MSARNMTSISILHGFTVKHILSFVILSRYLVWFSLIGTELSRMCRQFSFFNILGANILKLAYLRLLLKMKLDVPIQGEKVYCVLKHELAPFIFHNMGTLEKFLSVTE